MVLPIEFIILSTDAIVLVKSHSKTQIVSVVCHGLHIWKSGCVDVVDVSTGRLIQRVERTVYSRTTFLVVIIESNVRVAYANSKNIVDV
jgi:hypothetical protein